MKTLKSILYTLLFLTGVSSGFSQSVLISTGFDSYIGSIATAPAGWSMSLHQTGASGTFYTTTGNYGATSPSYKMAGTSGDSVIILTPPFANADSVSYFYRMNGGGSPTAPQSRLDIFQSADSINWFMISSQDTMPTTGITVKRFVPSTATHLKFVYYKVAGNLAIDDIKVLDYVTGVPTASSISNSDGCIGDTVHFTDNSNIIGANLNGWTWDFGDGSPTASSQNAAHLYTSTGPFNVHLTITADNSTTDDTIFVVNIRPLPVIHITGSPISGCAPLLVNFIDSSTVAGGGTLLTQCKWKFGTGDSANVHNTSYTYANAGTYTVKLTDISNFGCVKVDSVHNMITVNASPVASFTTTISQGDVTFNNTTTGGTTYSWNFDDAGSTSTSPNPMHTYTANGSYNVCLTATGPGGCTDTICQNVNIVGLGLAPIVESPITLSITPNPSKGVITVDVSSMNSDNTNVRVFTIIGKEIEHLDVNQIGQGKYMIDLSNQVDGFYFVRVYTPKDVYTWRVALSR